MNALPIVFALSLFARSAVASPPCTTDTIALRGQLQHLHMCGDRSGTPVIVTSGDGGWIHLAPHVADLLAAQGYFVVGFDSKAYLTSNTETSGPLTPANIAADFAALIAKTGSQHGAPILIGVSEGAALSVVAASSDTVKPHVAGVIALGLGEMNELAWRFRDSIIYLTKRVPDEPCFRSSAYIDKVAPLPLVLIQSTSDEYVPRAEADRLAALARQPKRVAVLNASDHAFSNRRPELDATLDDSLRWIGELTGRSRSSERTDPGFP
jgi:dienelactone hydrolase